MVTDKSLLDAIKSPEANEWQEFYAKYWNWLLAHAKADIHRAEDREDICQIVLVKAARAMAKFDYDPQLGSFRGWLLTILNREVVRFLMRDRRNVLAGAKPIGEANSSGSPIRLRFMDPPDSWPKPLARKSLVEAVERTLGQLRAKVQPGTFEMFLKHAFQEEDPETLAQNYGRSLNAVYTSNSKTNKLFRELLKKNEAR